MEVHVYLKMILFSNMQQYSVTVDLIFDMFFLKFELLYGSGILLLLFIFSTLTQHCHFTHSFNKIMCFK